MELPANETVILERAALESERTHALLQDLSDGGELGAQLRQACIKGDEEEVKRVIGIGAHVNARDNWNGHSALFNATQYGYIKIVQYLLDKGAFIDDCYNLNMLTPLMVAASYGYKEIATLLLERGAFVNIQDFDGKTALMHAVRNGYTDIVRVLLDHGADVTIRGTYGKTALLYAAGYGHEEIVQMLTQKGASFDPRDIETAFNTLKSAIYVGCNKGAHMLIGLLAYSRDLKGKTALDYAWAEKSHNIVVQLIEHLTR